MSAFSDDGQHDGGVLVVSTDGVDVIDYKMTTGLAFDTADRRWVRAMRITGSQYWQVTVGGAFSETVVEVSARSRAIAALSPLHASTDLRANAIRTMALLSQFRAASVTLGAVPMTPIVRSRTLV